MTAKELTIAIDELFKENTKGYVTFEKLIRLFDKAPNATQIKKISELSKKYKTALISAAEATKLKEKESKKASATKKKLSDEEVEKELDLSTETDLLEWSRSDSPVRIYLRAKWVKFHY